MQLFKEELYLQTVNFYNKHRAKILSTKGQKFPHKKIMTSEYTDIEYAYQHVVS